MSETKKKKTETVNNPGGRGGYTTSQDVSEADKKTGETAPKGGSGKRGLTGVPVGTPVFVGQEGPSTTSPEVVAGEASGPGVVTETTKYALGDGMKYLGQMDNNQRSRYLALLSQIPGVYPKGAAYSKKELQAIAATQYIPIRDVDAKALENVMRYADTLGLTFEDAVDRLSAQPALAVSFFNVKAPKGKAVTSTESLIAEINDKFQNTLDVNVPGDIAKKYASEIQASQRADRPLSAQERENILLKYLENAADDLAKQAGDAEFQPRGVLGEYITDLRREYFENGLPIDENRIYRMAVKSLRDPQELDSNKQRIRQRAELVFPPLKEYIARGESVRDVLSPYMKLKANIFEMNDADIKPSDMYDVMEGDKLKNINDYKMSLYRSPEYKKTNAYFERQLSDTRGLLNYLGIE